jgi:hypothetical protein
VIGGGASERLAFILSLDANGAVREFKRVGDTAEKELGRADNRLDRMGSRMQSAGAGAMAFAGIAGVALAGFARAADEAEHQHRRLDNTMANAPQLANASRAALDDLADTLQDTTTAEGDAVTGLIALEGQFGLTQSQIERLTPLIVDLSSKMGVDLETAGRAVLRSTDGTSTALRRMGIDVADTNNKADAFAATVTALSDSVGGFAEAEAKSFSGQLTILKNNLGDVAEGLGTGVIGAVNHAMGPLTSLADKFAEMDPKTQSAIGSALTYGTALVGVAGAASFTVGSVMRMGDTWKRAGDALNLSANATASLKSGLGALGIAAAGLGAVVIGIQAINDEAREMGASLGEAAHTAAYGSTSFDQFNDAIGRIRVGIEDLDATRRGSIAPWDADKRRQLIEGKLALEETLGPLVNMREEIINLAAAENIGLDAATRQVLTRRDQAAAHDELVASVGEAEAAEIEAATATERMGASAAAAAAEVQDLAAAIREAYEATVIGTDLEADYQAAIDSLTASVAENGATLDLNTEQGRANYQQGRETADAVLALMQRRYEETGSMVEAVAAGNIYVQNLRDQLRAAGLTDAQVQSYIDTLHLTPSTIATSFVAHTADAVREIQALQRLAAGVAAGSHEISFHSNTEGARASGGPVSAGKQYLVGERGPELFTPSTGGTIVPNDALVGGAPSGGASSAADATPIHVVVQLDGQAIVDALVKQERRNGPLPIIVKGVA